MPITFDEFGTFKMRLELDDNLQMITQMREKLTQRLAALLLKLEEYRQVRQDFLSRVVQELQDTKGLSEHLKEQYLQQSQETLLLELQEEITASRTFIRVLEKQTLALEQQIAHLKKQLPQEQQPAPVDKRTRKLIRKPAKDIAE